MQIDVAAFLDAPKKAAVYVLEGDSDFLKDEALGAIARLVAPCRTVDPAEVPLASVLDDLRTAPMFESAKAIRVRGAEAFLAGEDGEALRSFLDRPPSHGALVLDVASIDGRTRLGKALAKGERAIVIACDTPYDAPPPWKADGPAWDYPLCDWTVRRARSAGIDLDAPVAHRLVRRVRSSLGAIAQAVSRLAEAHPPGASGRPSRITVEDLEALVPRTPRPASGFDVAGAALDGDLTHALLLLGDIFDAGYAAGNDVILEPGVFGPLIVGAFHSELSRVRRLGDLPPGTSDDDAARALGTKRPFIPRIRSRLRRLARRGPDTPGDALRRADADLKSSRRPAAIVLEELVIRLAGPLAAVGA